MKKPICIILFLIIHSCIRVCHAQDQIKIDSFLNELSLAKDDSNRIWTLDALSRYLWQKGDFENAKKYGETQLQLAEKIKYKRQEAGAHSNIGIAYENQGNYTEALKHFETTIRISEEISDYLGLGHGYLESGNVNYYQGKYSEALKNFLKALENYKVIDNLEGIGSVYIVMGVIHYQQDNDDDALKNLNAGLAIVEQRGDQLAIAGCNINLALIYTRQKKYPEALQRNFAALKIMEDLGDERSIFYCKNNIGEIYLEQGNYTHALKYCMDALKLAEDIGDNGSKIYAYRNLGTIYLQLKDYPESRNYLEKGLSLAKSLGSNAEIMGNYQTLSQLDADLGLYKPALENYKLYVSYKDSVYSETSKQQIAELNTKYETEKKDEEILLLNKDKQIREAEINKQKLLKFSFIGGLSLIIILLLLVYKSYRTRQVLTFQNLRNKISDDLHDDIGSTLNSISVYSAVATQDTSRQTEALEMIGDASRKIIDAMSDIVWTINPENDDFESMVMRMRSLAFNLFRAKQIEFNFLADENLHQVKLLVETRRNFFLLYKEAINNIVKYAEATQVSIQLTYRNPWVKLRIQDNGMGFDVSQSYNGNGLNSMKRRAKEMKADLKIDSTIGVGTLIELAMRS